MKKIKHLSFILFFTLFTLSCSTHTPKTTTTPTITPAAPLAVNDPATLTKPTVLLISIDGYRSDYTKKFSPPELSKIAKEGAVSAGMIPVFPSKTFPNHLSLITGRYAENHGIVANNFYDFSRPENKQLYQLFDTNAVSDGTWYQANPLWVLAEQQGMRSACFFWPSSEAEISGFRPTYFKKYSKTTTNEDRVNGVLNWLNLPEATRPHFITVYFSDVDSKGHEFGPDSLEVKKAVLEMDGHIHQLMDGIKKLSYGVNVVIVSDHGMAKLDPKKYIYLDDYVDLSKVAVGDTGPQVSIYAKNNSPEQKAEIEKIAVALKQKAKANHFTVYHRNEIPKKYHLGKSIRAGDLLITTPLPYSVGIHDPRFHPPVATHGYDPAKYPEMNASFLAIGPNLKGHQKLAKFKNIDVYPFLVELLKLKQNSEIDGTAKTLHGLLKN